MLIFGGISPVLGVGVFDIQCINITSITVVPDTCGAGEGSILVEHDGAAPFTYEWSHDTALTDSMAIHLTSGSYSLRISDDAGCSADTVLTIGNISPLDLTVSTTPDTCGAPNGSASVEVVANGSETPPFTFQWDANAGNQTTPVVQNLSTGSYTVTATDANGCQATIDVSIGSVRNGFDGSMVPESVSCYGDSNAVISVNPSGGNGVYAYSWTRVGDATVLGTQASLTGVGAGQYRVVVTDPDGNECSYTGQTTVSQPDSVVAGYTTNPASDCRDANGEAFANPTGGVPPYQISWSTGESTNDISGLLPGFYTLTVTDDNGCSDTKTLTMVSSTGPDFEVQILQEDDCGLGEGIARINITNGTAPYDIRWWVLAAQPRDTGTSDFFQYYQLRTPPGHNDYTVVVVDSDSCVNLVNYRMPGNPPLTIRNLSTTTNYCELGDGTASIELDGGSPPYTYSWTTSPPQTTPTASELLAGIYSITIRDTLNCSITDTVEIVDEEGFELEVITTDVSCYGENDGTAIARVPNGRWPIAFEWENPRSFETTLNNLPGGVYTVTATDVDGCERTAYGEVEAVTFIQANFTANPPPSDTSRTVLSSAGFEFMNESEGAEEYLWDFGDGMTSTEVSPVHVYQDTGHFYVKLTAISNQGACADSITLGPFIITLDGLLHVPNAFSPNGDGFNDFFVVAGDFLLDYDLRVYSRWGEEIFQSSSIDDSWDGRMPNGKGAPQGVYVFRLKATAVGNKSFDQTGTITLLR